LLTVGFCSILVAEVPYSSRRDASQGNIAAAAVVAIDPTPAKKARREGALEDPLEDPDHAEVVGVRKRMPRSRAAVVTIS